MTTDYKHIEELLNRFFEGETSNKEEQQLYDFFSRKDIPEHLLRYKPVFNYFESDLKEELIELTEPTEWNQSKESTDNKTRKYRINILVGIAASLLILLMLSPLFLGKASTFNPYEGSYIVRNGKRITDINIIKPELEATIQKVLQQEEEANRMLMCLMESEQQFERVEQHIVSQREDIINNFPDGIKEEVRRIIEME